MELGEVYDYEKAKLLSLIPPIKRARGNRLYDYRGNRYLDCYRDGGHSILGHRAGELNKVLKNMLSKGLVVELPSIYSERCKKALRKLFPGYSFLLTRNFEAAMRALPNILSGKRRFVIFDPLTERVVARIDGEREEGETKLFIWRPFTDKVLYGKNDILLPILPFSLSNSPFVVCFPFEVDTSVTVEDGVASPMLLAGFTRAIYDLIKAEYPNWIEEKFPGSFPLWKRHGPYMIYTGRREDYESLFKGFVERGIIVSPSVEEPSIIPFELSDGEYKKLLRAFLMDSGF